jgi:hypothetical protein
MADLIKPKEINLVDEDGIEKTFILSKFPAVEGREIVAGYTFSSIPKVGCYAENEAIMFKNLSYASVKSNDVIVRLNGKTLVNNHLADFEMLTKLEWHMMEYNCSFLRGETISNFLNGLFQKALTEISRTLTASSVQS